ncbi:MAG: AAA family ATPase [Proteobacteria bacterium]|nr:AAA family ATPase [Pseudomonadota bacterium]
MKILGIRFKNLNSLTGEWRIDFTHPDFTSNGIFAITGPTGAGKTTVLDALCLGLYGRTPRLDKVTKSSNEIMSRQAGECFAEVEFETLKGRYRCHWSQHRARKKPGGELQQSKHEICEADSGKVLESRIALVGEFIEKATGMDFERFTRSMLLAQGGFAIFLKAPPNERAPILEQITGTEIYSKISVKVHERRVTENNKLEILQAELKGIHILSEDEERDFNTGLKEKQNQEAQISAKAKELVTAANWIEEINKLEKDIEDLGEKRKDSDKRRQEFEPEAKKLEKSRKAAGLEADYRGVTTLRTQQETELKELDSAVLLLPEKDKVLHDALSQKISAENTLNEAQKKQYSEMQTFKQVRDLDTLLREQKKQLTGQEKKIEETKKQISAYKINIEKSENHVKKSLASLEAISDYMIKHGVDAALMTNLSAIERGFASFQDVDKKHKKALKELDAAEKKKEKTSADCKKLEAEHNKLHLEFKKLRDEVKSIGDEISNILKGRDISQLRSEHENLKDRERLLVQTEQTIARIDKTFEKKKSCEKKIDELTRNNLVLSDEIKTHNEKKEDLEKDIASLETQESLLNRIHNLEEERKRLEDGKPCPLCGATDHPYAKANVPALSETESELKKAKAEFKKISDKLTKLENERVKNTAALEYSEKEIKEHKTLLDTDEKQCKAEIAALNIEATPGERAVKVHNQLTAVKSKITEISHVIAMVEEKRKKEKSAQTNFEKVREKQNKAEKALQDSIHNMKTAADDYNRQINECNALKEEVEKAQMSAIEDIQAFGINNITIENLNPTLQKLTERRNTWQAKDTEKNSLEKKIDELKAEIGKNKTMTDKLEADLADNNLERSNLKREYEALNLKRCNLFGEKSPDIEEKLLAEAIDTAGKALETKRELYARIEKEISALKDKMDFLKGKTEKRAVELIQAEQKISEQFKTTGFEDEADFRSCCLSKEERELLASREKALYEEKLELDTRFKDKSDALLKERGKNLTDLSKDLLAEKIHSAEDDLKELRLDIGGIIKSLADNEKQKKDQVERIKNIEAQKTECARWDNLHQLIGSADGKKFRNFAQGLTFEMMISHANRQLKKMTDRYLLIRDTLQPLELNVVDNYQAGEIRSTKNLSGGESFIVSLALALGLSQMASRNVRVDSLFLDEGFGTLDEDSLETAIETLAQLQQDGKLIGVISHVPALKERIGTQIEVISEAGGRSRLSGPGCYKI